MAAEVLSGKPVSEVPVQVLSEYATVINADTAAAIGLDTALVDEILSGSAAA